MTATTFRPKDKNAARAWLQGVVAGHLPRNARQYKFKVYHGGTQHNALGLTTDLMPAEGTLVELSDDWALFKVGRNEFLVCDKDLMEVMPEVGTKVRVTPYARRRFDGQRLDAPTESVTDGVKFKTFIIGETVSRLPIDKDGLNSDYLRDMITQIEELRAPDGVRTIAQMLIDAGATSADLGCKDPMDDEVIAMPPTLRFRVDTAKHQGYIDVIYDRGLDYYRLRLIEAGSLEIVRTVEEVSFDEMGGLIADLIDDGRWRLAKVEVLAKKGRKAA
jgi:hypothetical protein